MGKHKRRRGDKEVKSVAAATWGWIVEWFDAEKSEPVIEQYLSAMDAELRVQELGVIGITARWGKK